MKEQDIKQFALACQLAAKIHEESWIAEESWGSYKIDLYEACYSACRQLNIPETLARPMELAFHWWNDLLDWAESPEKDLEQYREFVKNKESGQLEKEIK